jgi:signal transduction histidine kinase
MESSGSKSSLENSLSFDQILRDTVRMVRLSWKTDFCAFMQTDDKGEIHIRALDASKSLATMEQKVFKATVGVIGRCVGNNQLVDTGALPESDPAHTFINALVGKTGMRVVLVPVTGEARALGLLALGPFAAGSEFMSREGELKSAGALCAVLAAHWRLYEWISHFLPQVNHELRTPLTAVQGSIGMVLGGMFGQLGGEVRQMLEMAHKGCERTVRAIEDYLNTQKPPADDGK